MEFFICTSKTNAGDTLLVAQLVTAMRCKLEGRGFDSPTEY